MTELRWIGFFLGSLSLLYFFAEFRRNRTSRGDFILGLAFSLALLVVSLFPGWVTVLRDMLALEDSQFSRLIAVTIMSNLLLWLLFFHFRLGRWEERRQMDHLIRYMALSKFREAYPMPLAPVAVVIPAYNEAENIQAVLAGIPPAVAGLKTAVIVVDDGSDDGTAACAAQAGAAVVTSPVRRGGGAALRIGFHIAQSRGAEIVVTMDGDGQHLGQELIRLVEPLCDDRLDLVIGSRILGQREKDSSVRLVGIYLFNFLIRLLAPVKLSDCSNGFRACRVRLLSQLNLQQNQYHAPEFILEANRRGWRIGEVPVTVKRRRSGHSKKGGNWKYGFRFALSILRTWWR